MNFSAAAQRGLAFGTRPGGTSFGFVNPSTILDKMSSLDRAAADLNGKLLRYSNDADLKAAWVSWFAHWQAFYAPYASLGARWFTLPGTLAQSDEIDAQTNENWRQYTQLQTRYTAERDAAGKPLPAPIVPLPNVPPLPSTPPGPHSGFTVPWWIWAGLGVAVLGVGIYAYVQYKEIAIGARALGFGRKAAPDARRDQLSPSMTSAEYHLARIRDAQPVRGFLPSHGGGRVLGRDIQEPEAYDRRVDYDVDDTTEDDWGGRY